MANRGLGTLTVDIVAKIGGFTAGMDKAERASKQRMDAIAKTARQTGVALAAAFAGVASAIGVGVKDAIAAADAINDMSIRTGVAAEALSRLEVAAKLTDTSLESLQTGFIKLARAQSEALAGGEQQEQMFGRLGVTLNDLRTLGPDVLLGRIADGITAIENPALQAAAAVEAFGRSGADLLPLLKEGSRGIEEYNRLADELGVTLSGEAALAAAEFSDQIDMVGLSLDGAFRQAMVAVLPTVTELAKQINSPEFRKGFAELVKGFASSAEEALKFMGVLDRFAERMREHADTSAALDDYSSTLAGFASEQENLREKIDAINAGEPTGFPFRSREEVLDVYAAKLEKVTALLQHFERVKAEAEAKAKAGEAAASAAVVIPAFDGGTTEIRAPASGGGRSRAQAAEWSESIDQIRAGWQALRDDEEAVRQAWDQLQAQLNGPMASALFDHQQRLEEIDAAGKAAGASAEEIAAAKAKETQAFEASTAALQDQLDPYPKLIEELEFEASLLRMTNAERATAIQLRGADAESVAKYGDALQALNEDYERLSEAQAAVDEFQASFEDSVASVLDGSKSIKEAIGDLVDDFIAQMARAAAHNLAESLFSSGGGSSGGGWASTLASLFSSGGSEGGFASGSPYKVDIPSKALLSEVYGPPVMRPIMPEMGGPTGMMMRSQGGPQTITQNITVQGSVSRQSLSQLRIEQYRQMRKFQGEFG